MRRNRPPRSRLQHLALVLAALGILLFGYYLGNRYQYGQLAQTAAIMLDTPLGVDTAGLPPPLAQRIDSSDYWVILLPGEPGPACDQLLDHYIEVFNRLAIAPRLQDKLHLALLNSSATAPTLGWKQIDWAETYPVAQEQLLRITGELGIAPIGTRWCRDVQATAAVIGPGAEARALLPMDKPARIAESLRLIIPTFDPTFDPALDPDA